VFGVLEFIGAAAGGDDWQRPLAGLRAPAAVSVEAHAERFQMIKSVDDLDRELAGAGDGAMLDFYADWCVECKRMERNTFPDPRVAPLMDRMSLLQADVTANDEVDQALMRRFRVIGSTGTDRPAPTGFQPP
jgi:thiol:disulfide interchange protein DsbD